MARFASIRLRITLWYVLTVVLILGASGAVWYLSLSSILHEEVDQRLEFIAARVQQEIPAICPESNGQMCRELAQKLRLAGSGAMLRVLDGNGQILCATAEDFASLATGAGSAAGMLPGALPYSTLVSPAGVSLRLLTLPLVTERSCQLQLAISLEPAQRALKQLLVKLVALLPLPLAVLALGGWFLAHRALAPVQRMARAMENIRVDTLSQRLPGEDDFNELGRLVKSFNRMLEHLENSFRRTRQFAADASHELRTPLTVLRGETEVALRWSRTPEEFREILQSNLEEIDRMGRTVEDLLLLAKSEAGEAPMEMREINLNHLLQDLSHQGQVLGAKKGVSVLLRLPEESLRIQGNELGLRRMILNLLSNAVKFTPAGGEITLSLEKHEPEATITVRDSGIGMAAEHLERIFDRFYRITGSEAQETGSGLGLSIVKLIVEAHQGRIAVESAPGQGSSFRVSLPLLS